jgi:phage-related protein
MTVGFEDLAFTFRVPDRGGVTKSIKPIYSLTTFGDGYENRVSIGTDAREETYSITFTNRPIEEIRAISGFFDNRGKYKTFDFTVPDSNEPSGEKIVVVYCDSYTVTYLNDVIGSITAKFVRVYELVSGTSSVTVSSGNFNINEGEVKTVNVSSLERGPELLYWSLDGASLADFQALNGSFNMSGTTSLSQGSFDIGTLADLATEGPETFTLSVREVSIFGTVLAQVNVTIIDTSRGPETFNFVDAQDTLIGAFYILQQDTDTVYVSVQNFEPEDIYYEISGSDYSTSTGTISLTGDFASSSGSFSITAPSTNVDLTNTLRLRKDSVSGAIVDTITLFTLAFAGAQAVDEQGAVIDSISVGPNSSPVYEATVFFKGTLFPIEQIYWTIEGAVQGVDFDQVQGSFLPTGNDNFSEGSFVITKQVPSPEVVEFYTLNLRKTGFTGQILDTVDLIVETTGFVQRFIIDTTEFFGSYEKNEGSISRVFQTIISTEEVDTVNPLGGYSNNQGTLLIDFQDLAVAKQTDTVNPLGGYSNNQGTIQIQLSEIISTEQVDNISMRGSYTKNSGSISITRT